MNNSLFRFFALATALAAPFFATAAQATPGDLYVSDDSGSIYQYTPPSGTKTTFGSGLQRPRGLAFDGKGNLFQSDSNNQLIYKYIVGQPFSASTYISGLGTPQGLAFDTNGNLFVADSFNRVIYKFTPNLTKTTFASGFTSPIGIAFDKDGNLFVADNGANIIVMVTPAGAKTTFASGLNAPQNLAFDSAGNLFVTDAGSDGIYEFTPAGVRTTFASGLLGPFGLAFDSAGNLYESSFGFNTIYKFTPTGVKTTFTSSGLSSPSFLAFEPDTSKLRNLSTRGVVETGDNVLIAGFILGGNGLVTNKVVVRAIGPSLTAAGVPNALQDPTLELHNASGDVIASNDNWRDTQQIQIQATGLAPTDPRESTILTTLPAGPYTAIVRGVGNSTGVGLVEVYDVR